MSQTLISLQAQKATVRQQIRSFLHRHNDLVLGVQSALVWERPIHFGVISVATFLSLWILKKLVLGSSVLTILGLGYFLYNLFFLISLFVPLPANIWGPKMQTGLTPKTLSINEIENYLVGFRFLIADSCQEVERIRESNPRAVTLKLIGFSLAVALLGALISGYTVSVIVAIIALVLPGVLANNLIEKLGNQVVAVKPHIPKIKSFVSTSLNKLYVADEPVVTTTEVLDAKKTE